MTGPILAPDATFAERLLSRAAGRRVHADDTVVVDVDEVMVVDSIAPTVADLVEGELGGRVARPERVSVVFDHVAPAPTVAVAESHARTRAWAAERGITVYDVGRGIGHHVMMEEGRVRPGTVVLASDSHATQYGAVGAFGTGMGATDVAVAVSTGRTWLRVPRTLVVRLEGRLASGVSAKDVALETIGRLGADGATYGALEFQGADALSFSERLTLANMAVEAGAKVGLVPPDEAVRARYGEVPAALARPTDPARAERVLDLDLDALAPRVSLPGRVDDVRALHEAREHHGRTVQQVFVGTCTNGHADDLRTVARALEGRSVAEGTRLVVAPASARALEDVARDGTLSVLLAAGAVLATPGCGPCMGRHAGVLAEGELCVSSGNRNFAGRMGAPGAEVILASPETAAACAVAGRLPGGTEVAHA